MGVYYDAGTQSYVVRASDDQAADSTATITVTASYSVALTDRNVIANGATVTVSLPDPTTVTVGRVFRVKNVNLAAATVNSAGVSKTLDGVASQSLAQWARAAYLSDGTQWLTV